MSSAFNSDKYYDSGDWKTAVNHASSYYEKLGFSFGESLNERKIKEAFLKRQGWWQDKGEISHRGVAHPHLKEVGPFIQEAIKNLYEAKSTLLDPVMKVQYDKTLQDKIIRKAEDNLITYIKYELEKDNTISEDQKSNLFKKADTLRIHPDRVDEIIASEMAKTGATFKFGDSSSGSTSSTMPFDAFLNKTYYEILGLNDDADYAQIKEANDREHQKYIKAKDKAKASARFYVVSEAWECLRDPVKRREYDEILKQPKTPVPTGTPKLVIKCNDNYTFTDIKRGALLTEKIAIRNPEGGLLQGSIKSDSLWLAPDRNKILERHEQELFINISTATIPLKTYRTTGTISINTNGGDRSIQFTVILQEYEVELIKFRKSYIPLVAAFCGFIGSFTQSPVINFIVYSSIIGFLLYVLSRILFNHLINKNINALKYPPLLIQGAAVVMFFLTIILHSSSIESSLNPYFTPKIPNPATTPPPLAVPPPSIEPPSPPHAPAPGEVSSPVSPSEQIPQSPPINITRAVIASGLDTNKIPSGVDTKFTSGHRRLYYYVSYHGAIQNTIFNYKWYNQYGNTINEAQSNIINASGNAWNYFDYNFQPGKYEVYLYANGQQLNSTIFNVSAISTDTQSGDEQQRQRETGRQRGAELQPRANEYRQRQQERATPIHEDPQRTPEKKGFGPSSRDDL